MSGSSDSYNQKPTPQTSSKTTRVGPTIIRRDTAPPTADQTKKKKAGNNAVQGASAAGARAVSTQMIAFYFRYPIKSFMRTRVDYMQVARAINPRVQANEAWSLRQSTIGLLAHAVRERGWSFIPKQVLPPLIANTSIGALLYASYLQVLQRTYSPSAEGTKRIYPPPPVWTVFCAGASAGAIQSLAAAPLDALSVRFDVRDMLDRKYDSMIQYGRYKLREIGLRGVFQGFTLSFVKESLGYGIFFATFEYVKQQAYYDFLTQYYGTRQYQLLQRPPSASGGTAEIAENGVVKIHPYYTLEPVFLLCAGISAGLTSSLAFHPLSRIQNIHYSRLEALDFARLNIKDYTPATFGPSRYSWLFQSMSEYEETYRQCEKLKHKAGGWRRWLYRGFLSTTLKNTPSTAAALIVFELMRRKFGEEGGDVSILHDGFEIML